MAHKLTARYLQRRAASATDSPSASGREQHRKARTPTPAGGLARASAGRQGPCPVCGRSARLLRTQVLDAGGDRVDWICSGCRG